MGCTHPRFLQVLYGLHFGRCLSRYDHDVTDPATAFGQSQSRYDIDSYDQEQTAGAPAGDTGMATSSVAAPLTSLSMCETPRPRPMSQTPLLGPLWNRVRNRHIQTCNMLIGRVLDNTRTAWHGEHVRLVTQISLFRIQCSIHLSLHPFRADRSTPAPHVQRAIPSMPLQHIRQPQSFYVSATTRQPPNTTHSIRLRVVSLRPRVRALSVPADLCVPFNHPTVNLGSLAIIATLQELRCRVSLLRSRSSGGVPTL